jgi:hypothetical protein
VLAQLDRCLLKGSAIASGNGNTVIATINEFGAGSMFISHHG